MYKCVIAVLAALLLSAQPSIAADLGIMDATWYGIGDGSRSHTASGMPFSAEVSARNPHIMSYYKLDYPWGTRFLLTNVANGSTLCVSKQDYGPKKMPQKVQVEVDLTQAGAKMLGVKIGPHSGKAQVRVQETWCYIPEEFIPAKFNFGRGPS